VCAPFDFFSSASGALVVMVGAACFCCCCCGCCCCGCCCCCSASWLLSIFFSVFLSGVVLLEGFFSTAAFAFSGLDLTRHFSGSSRAVFSSWRPSPDFAEVFLVFVFGATKVFGEGEGKERKKQVLITMKQSIKMLLWYYF